VFLLSIVDVRRTLDDETLRSLDAWSLFSFCLRLTEALDELLGEDVFDFAGLRRRRGDVDVFGIFRGGFDDDMSSLAPLGWG
jgi:hypothetical protein